jgi:hypothetical protein
MMARGVMIVTFCYGRDVIEMYQMEWEQARAQTYTAKQMDGLIDIAENLAQRVWYVLRGKSQHLDSCIQYRGRMMPMISCLLWKRRYLPKARFKVVGPHDYALAMTADPSKVYACPVDRIEELRKLLPKFGLSLVERFERASDHERAVFWTWLRQQFAEAQALHEIGMAQTKVLKLEVQPQLKLVKPDDDQVSRNE